MCIGSLGLFQDFEFADDGQFLRFAVCGVHNADDGQNGKHEPKDVQNGQQEVQMQGDGQNDGTDNAEYNAEGDLGQEQVQPLPRVETGELGRGRTKEGDKHQRPEVGEDRHGFVLGDVRAVKLPGCVRGVVQLLQFCAEICLLCLRRRLCLCCCLLRFLRLRRLLRRGYRSAARRTELYAVAHLGLTFFASCHREFPL